MDVDVFVVAVCVLVVLYVPCVSYVLYKGWATTAARMDVKEVTVTSNESSATCLICLEDVVVGDITNVLDCGHEFHKACIAAMQDHMMFIDAKFWTLKMSCPMCREIIKVVPAF